MTGEGVMYVFCSVDGESEASIPKLIIKKQRFVLSNEFIVYKTDLPS